MKSNIDLTENRMFSMNSQNPWNLTITDFFNTKVPWEIQLTQIHIFSRKYNKRNHYNKQCINNLNHFR